MRSFKLRANKLTENYAQQYDEKRETGLMQKTKYLKQVTFNSMHGRGCRSSSKPQVNMDETQNFADIKTFYIQPLNPINATLANHLSSAITQRLIEKGLTPSSEEDADIAVIPTHHH